MDTKILRVIPRYIFSSCVVVGVVTLGALYYRMGSILTEYYVNYLRSINDARAAQVESFLDNKKKRAVDFSSDGLVKDALYDIKHERNASLVSNTLRRHLIDNKLPADKSFYKVIALGANGVVVASTDDVPVGTDMSSHVLFHEGRYVPYIMSLSYDAIANVNSFAVAAPVLRNNEFVGVIVIKFLPDEVTRLMMGESALGSRSETYIIDEHGYLITPSKFLSGTNKGVLAQVVKTENAEDCLKDIEDFYRTDKRSIEKHEENIVTFKNYQGDDVLGTHAYVEDMKWCVLAEVDKTIVWEGRRGIFATSFAVLSVAASLATLVWFLIARKRYSV